MREKQGYRLQLEDIQSVFGNKRLLSKADVSRYTGECYRTVTKKYNFINGKITQSELARQLV